MQWLKQSPRSSCYYNNEINKQCHIKKSEIWFGFMGVITHFMDLCPSNFIRVSRAKPGPRALFGRLWCLYAPTWESVNSHNFGGSVLYALPQNGGNGLKDRCLILGNGPVVEKLEGLTFVWSRAKTVEGFSGAHASSLRSSAVLFDTSTSRIYLLFYQEDLPIGYSVVLTILSLMLSTNISPNSAVDLPVLLWQHSVHQ